MKKVSKKIPLDKTSNYEPEMEDGYTLIFATGTDNEIDYRWVDSIEEAKEIIKNIVDDGEIDVENIDNFEHIVGVFRGKLEPLEIEFTRTVEIGGK